MPGVLTVQRMPQSEGPGGLPVSCSCRHMEWCDVSALSRACSAPGCSSEIGLQPQCERSVPFITQLKEASRAAWP